MYLEVFDCLKGVRKGRRTGYWTTCKKRCVIGLLNLGKKPDCISASDSSFFQISICTYFFLLKFQPTRYQKQILMHSFQWKHIKRCQIWIINAWEKCTRQYRCIVIAEGLPKPPCHALSLYEVCTDRWLLNFFGLILFRGLIVWRYHLTLLTPEHACLRIWEITTKQVWKCILRTRL